MPTFDELLEEQGDLGKFQWFSFIILSVLHNMTGPLTYSFAYLLYLPTFSCDMLQSGRWIHLKDGSPEYDDYCKPDYFCQHKDTIRYTIDTSSELSLNNWMTGYGLECSTPFFIAAFGQAYFIGYAISGLIAPPLMDKYGRKRAYAISRFG